MKAVVAAFNQEKALVGAFSVIMNLRMEIFEALQEAVVIVSPRGLIEKGINSHFMRMVLKFMFV